MFLDAFSGKQVDPIFGAPTDGKNYASGLVGLVAPFSRGNVTIVSNYTAVHPLVNPNWLSDTRDQEVAVAGFKRSRTVFASKAMLGVIIGAEAFPGAYITSDADILDAIRGSASSSIFHTAGINAMGTASNPLAVVVSKGRVFGVKGLRVVDSSTFPILPAGHPMVHGL